MVSHPMTFRALWLLLAIGLLVVYFPLNPEHHLFPKCPFFWLTGWKCPGCGSQRALHHLLHGNVLEAFRVNPLFVLSLPYVLFGLMLEYSAWGMRQIELKRVWYGGRAAKITLVGVLVFWLCRNV